MIMYDRSLNIGKPVYWNHQALSWKVHLYVLVMSLEQRWLSMPDYWKMRARLSTVAFKVLPTASKDNLPLKFLSDLVYKDKCSVVQLLLQLQEHNCPPTPMMLLLWEIQNNVRVALNNVNKMPTLPWKPEKWWNHTKCRTMCQKSTSYQWAQRQKVRHNSKVNTHGSETHQRQAWLRGSSKARMAQRHKYMTKVHTQV